MNITKETIDSLNATLKLKLEQTDYEERVNNVLQDYKKKARIDGFRPGKVPFGMIKKMYYKPVLIDEINKLVSESLTKYLVDEKLNILGEPLPSEKEKVAIDWDNDKEFNFTFDIAIAPDINLKLSGSDKIPYYTIEVDDKMLESYTKGMASRMGSYENVDVIKGDTLIKGRIEQVDDTGNVIEEGIKNDTATLFTAAIKDEKIKKQFEGKKVGDTLQFDVKKAFPNDTELSNLLNIKKEEVARIKPLFQLTFVELTQYKDAEINQEFYDKVYGKDAVKGEAEYKKKLVEDIGKNMENESEYRFFVDAKESLLKKAKFDLPEEFLKRWLFLTNEGKFSKEDIDKEYKDFENDLRWQLIKEKLGKENDIKVSDEDAMEYAKKVASYQLQQYGYGNLPDDQLAHFAKGILEKDEEKRKIYEKKFEEKVVAYVRETVKLDKKKITKEKFEKLYEKK
ncbi:MAG: trigger factor [Bacteroidales bacterium]|nr:trigger factor [Bacteroidales bacterium]